MVSYSAAISACANVGEWQRALSLLMLGYACEFGSEWERLESPKKPGQLRTRMGQKKVTPNTVSVSTVEAVETKYPLSVKLSVRLTCLA